MFRPNKTINMAKKQTKADKAFIDKISTLGINTGAKPGHTCGAPTHIGVLKGQVLGQEVEADVYTNGPVPPEALRPRERKPPVARNDEQSFSA